MNTRLPNFVIQFYTEAMTILIPWSISKVAKSIGSKWAKPMYYRINLEEKGFFDVANLNFNIFFSFFLYKVLIIDSSSVVNWTVIVWIHVHNKPGDKIECFLEYCLDRSQFFQNSWENTEAWHFVMDYKKKKKIVYRLPTKKPF